MPIDVEILSDGQLENLVENHRRQRVTTAPLYLDALREGLAERAEFDVASDVRDVAASETAVVRALHGVVQVETVGGLGRRLDVPREHRHAEAFGDVPREHGLAGPRLALQQQRTLEGDRAVHRVDERPRGDVTGGPLES